MRISGKLVVLSIFAVAIVMAGFALWWNWGLGRRSLNYWGDNGALLIRDARSVTIVKLKPPFSTSAAKDWQLPLGSKDLSGLEKKEIRDAKGLVHARHSFLEDASYEWDQSPSPDLKWEYALLFQGADDHVFIMLDLKNGVAGSSKSDKAVRLSPKTADGWKLFISRYFPEATGKSSQPVPSKAK